MQKFDYNVLGTCRNKEDDQFKFSVQQLLKSMNTDEVTKQELLQFLDSIFDQLWIISLAALQLKVMF